MKKPLFIIGRAKPEERRESLLLCLALSAMFMFMAHGRHAEWPDILLLWLLGFVAGFFTVLMVEKL